ncbi:MAG: NAD(P)/FAD-dependent oxidoreductase [Stenotrophomonas sp.]|uniref:NAD(P)/FAD-dependent oxidoreductase n=1 Tax=Stenotrophomonas sp. TaxID=69392 RepID=UPI003D6D6C2A
MKSPQDDVLIIGAGATGLATALALSEAGRQVRVLDAGRLGGATSHGNCGTITPSHAPPLAAPGVPMRALRWMLSPQAPLYIPPRFDPALWRWLARFAARCNRHDWLQSTQGRAALLNDSRQRLADWVRRYRLDCEFAEKGLDYVFRDQANFERHARECEALHQFGIDTRLIDGPDYLRQEPAFNDGVVGAIRFPGDASLRPDLYTAELGRVLRARGVEIEEHCTLLSFDPHTQGVRVQTSKGERRAAELVLATGAWSPALVRRVGLRMPIQPGKGYSITGSQPAQVPSRPVVLKDRSVFVIAWNGQLRLGGTMEFSGHDRRLNDTRLHALQQAAHDYLQQPLGDTVHERWYGWRPMTWDDMPILGRSPTHAHVWLAAGHGMLGISMSSGSGQLMADLMTGQTPAIDPTPYRAERFQ